MRRPVVVAVDGSGESLRAVEWAAREAVRRAAPLRIVSAAGSLPPVRAQHAPSATVGNAVRGVAAHGLACAVDRVAEVAPEAVIDTGLLDGPPAAAVSDSGAGAQLLVVGARGTGGFAGLLLGSVSERVASDAPCPVVVVREDTVAVHRVIVVGVHDPGDADEALGFAFEEAALREANLTAVHVVKSELEAEAERHLAAVLHEWQQKYPEVTVAQEVVRGNPAHVLADLSARADLVVIGRHGTTGGPGIGSIARAVLGHAHGPVAIVPAGPA